MSERVLLDNVYLKVTVDDMQKRIVVKRSKEGYTSLEVLRTSNTERDTAVAPFANKGFSLLLDARDGPLRNDPEFESETRAARARMFEVFHKVAVLVRTTVGVLQMQRLQRGESTEDSGRVRIFQDDEDAARAFLAKN